MHVTNGTIFQFYCRLDFVNIREWHLSLASAHELFQPKENKKKATKAKVLHHQPRP